MGRGREGGIGRGPIADLAGKRKVLRTAGPEARRAFGHGGPRVRHRRQGLVVHRYQLARVGRDRRGLGHDQRDRLAAIAHDIDGQRQVRGNRHVEALRQPELDVGRAGPVRLVRDRSHPVTGRVLPRQHPQHAGQRRGPGRVDRTDPGMGVGRAHHEGAGHPLGRGVIGKSALAGQQPPIFHSQARCTDLAGDRRGLRRHVLRELFRGAFACVLGAVMQDEARTFGRGSTLPLGPPICSHSWVRTPVTTSSLRFVRSSSVSTT